ncbi:MAG: glycosyltransferase [Alphaproteobacteria bacterium]
MRRVPHLSFISQQTHRDFETKIRKSPYKDGVVLQLGGDSLQLKTQKFSPCKQNFVYFGTIEPRKNVRHILNAFMNIWKGGGNAELFIIGRIDVRTQEELALINQLQNEPRFHYLGHTTDDVLRNVLRKARATIFVSTEEGFGIPPLESLAAGIPVIASNTLPSLNDLPDGGFLKIDPITPDTIAEAVKFLSVDSNAARLWDEAAQQTIPTWRNFTSRLSDWLHAA